MIKVLFLSWHFETPEIYLNSILKMTPGRKGIWKNVQAVLDPNEANFYFIMDGTNEKLPDMDKKAIFTYQHPFSPASPSHKGLTEKNCLLNFPLKDYLNPGEYWIDYNYDQLMTMESPIKTKNLACVATYQDHHSMYRQRQIFLRELVTIHPDLLIDLYGRPYEKYKNDIILNKYYKGVLGDNTPDATKGEHLTGKNIIKDYKYTLEFDVGCCINYFSERVYDSLLLWCTPIYFGCINLDDFLPHRRKAYRMFDINQLKQTKIIPHICQQDVNLKELAEVRNLLLNKYQTWAYAHFVVNNISALLNNQEQTYKEWINEY